MSSLKDFANKAGLTPKRLNEIENGKGEPPNLIEIEAIAKALEIPIWKLMHLVEEGELPEDEQSGA